jgi:UDP-N-acetylglucosamine 2-epimerase (non-hydrolysing)
MRRKILSVVGARPNFMKIAPLLRAFGNPPGRFESVLVHTGQHYDASMSDVFFGQLGMAAPQIQLGIGPGSQGAQTGRIMAALESVVDEQRPDLVLVVGDVNSTLAATLVAAKAGVPVAHVEAGLRSFDRRMPEEINRIVTDTLATFLFATEEDGVVNLRREGIGEDRIFLVGNVMIDTLLTLLPVIRERRMAAELGLTPGAYGVVTLHRPANVDDEATLERMLAALERIGARLPLVFPAHPRTVAQLARSGRHDNRAGSAIRIVDPLPYVEFISLVSEARLVLTDSGGIQEETTVLGVPCLTLRDNTERPVTIQMGTNRLVGTDPEAAVRAAEEVLAERPPVPAMPPLWDGKAAERIAAILDDHDWQAYEAGPRRDVTGVAPGAAR